MYVSFSRPVGVTCCCALSKSTSTHTLSRLYCTFPVTASLRDSIPRLRAMLTKKMSRERVSVSRDRQTPIGVCAIRKALVSGLSLMLCLVQSTSTVGSARMLSASPLLKASWNDCLKGAMIISSSTRGESWSLCALKWSSRISKEMSCKSLSGNVANKSSALSIRSVWL